MLPELEERRDIGLHFLGFTQFGKEVLTGTNTYRFTPYNDIDETLGFNILSYSVFETADYFLNQDLSLTKRKTATFGVVNDYVTEWLQNDVIHWANWRGNSQLLRIPRDSTDTVNNTSLGPTKKVPIAGFSIEYFLRFDYSRKLPGRVEEAVPSPFFVGAGFSLNTVNQELFLHAGSNLREAYLPRKFSVYGVGVRSVGVGGMIRGGLLLPGYHFDDLTSYYVNVQGMISTRITVRGFPILIQFAMTHANGFFVKSRSVDELAMINEFNGRNQSKVFQAKTPLNELFSSLRVRIGNFTFSTFNDGFGGKDKGPSFGAHIAFNRGAPNRAKLIEKYSTIKDTILEEK
ncbi:MAG: hypothetical protein ACRBF0_17460 [Calditrichia bacterium]